MYPDYTDYVTDYPDTMNPDYTENVTDNPDTNESLLYRLCN